MSVVDHTAVQDEERRARDQLRNLERARRTKAAQRTARHRAAASRLREVEVRIDALGAEYRAADSKARGSIRRELRDLGVERLDLKWGSA